MIFTAIVGPPNLTLILVNENLTVNLSMPLTPYRRRNGTYKSVQKVLPNWKYRVSLSEKGVHINNVSNIHSVTGGEEEVTHFCVM